VLNSNYNQSRDYSRSDVDKELAKYACTDHATGDDDELTGFR